MRDIYLDNGATTYPKPESVYRAMDQFSREIGGNPGRSGHHRSLEAGREILGAREAMASLLGATDPSRIIFTKNATEALNMALRCTLGPGSHAVITSLEHNAVWRPIDALATNGDISYTIVECERDGSLDVSKMRVAFLPNTHLIICVHASNVMGTILPIDQVAEVAGERGIPLLVDAAQTAGRLPLDPQAMDIQYLAFTGHKELFGPQGTGGLYVAPGARIDPIIYGGTSSLSDSPRQPEFLPDRCESGTLNGPGVAGLHAGVDFVLDQGVSEIRRHEEELTARLMEGLLRLNGATVYGPREWEGRVGIVSFNLDGFTSAEVATRLDEKHGICVRSGLHCAPLAHRTMGTLESGTVRASFSYLNGVEDIDCLLEAIGEIARG